MPVYISCTVCSLNIFTANPFKTIYTKERYVFNVVVVSGANKFVQNVLVWVTHNSSFLFFLLCSMLPPHHDYDYDYDATTTSHTHTLVHRQNLILHNI